MNKYTKVYLGIILIIKFLNVTVFQSETTYL